jgi:hypothetical protein
MTEPIAWLCRRVSRARAGYHGEILIAEVPPDFYVCHNIAYLHRTPLHRMPVASRVRYTNPEGRWVGGDIDGWNYHSLTFGLSKLGWSESGIADIDSRNTCEVDLLYL